MKNLFLEDELKYFFLRFYWDVCLFTLVKPIIMGLWFSLRHDFMPSCTLNQKFMATESQLGKTHSYILRAARLSEEDSRGQRSQKSLGTGKGM